MPVKGGGGGGGGVVKAKLGNKISAGNHIPYSYGEVVLKIY